MLFIKRRLAPIYIGMANGLFINKNYQRAINYYNKALRLDPNSGRLEFIYSCLGRCYLLVDNYNEAYIFLSKFFEKYETENYDLKDDFERKEIIEALRAYNIVSKYLGKYKQVKEIETELDKLMKT